MPIAEAASVHAAGPSTAPPVRAPQPRPEGSRHPPADLAHTPSAPGASPASPASDAAPPAQHATAPSWPCTPGCRCAWPHCAVARARPSIPPVASSGQPLALHSPGLAATQSPRAPQTTGIIPKAALTTARASMVASRPPPGTSGTQPPPTPPRRSPRPSSTVPPQSTSRSAAGPHAGLLPGGQARRLRPQSPIRTPPTSHRNHPPPWCCDDHLNPPNTLRSGTRSACSRASRTKSACAVLDTRQPTTRRAKTSMTKAT